MAWVKTFDEKEASGRLAEVSTEVMKHPQGEPFNVAQQRWVLRDALHALTDIQTPGVIIDLPYFWRRPGPWAAKK